MPYKNNDDLPGNVQSVLSNLTHAQNIFKEAYNNVWEECKNPESRCDDISREEVSQRVAWSAVKQKYKKDASGTWHERD